MADLERPKPLRALLFLIQSLTNGIGGPHREDAKYSWHSNPYMFAALRAGIIGLLDKLRPPGEIVTPPPGPEEEGWNEDEGNFRWQHTFPDSPEDYARNLVEALILQVQIQHGFEEARGRGFWTTRDIPRYRVSTMGLLMRTVIYWRFRGANKNEGACTRTR